MLNLSNKQDGPTGAMKIGGKRKPISVPSYSILTVPGITPKLNKDHSYLTEQAEHHILPNSLVVNSCYSTPEARRELVILISTTNVNVWIRQPLLAVEIFKPEIETQSYSAVMNRVGNKINIEF